LQSVYRNENALQQARVECAKAAAPFEFPRLAAVVHSGKDASPIKLERLTDAELEILSELLEKATDVAPRVHQLSRADGLVRKPPLLLYIGIGRLPETGAFHSVVRLRA